MEVTMSSVQPNPPSAHADEINRMSAPPRSEIDRMPTPPRRKPNRAPMLVIGFVLLVAICGVLTFSLKEMFLPAPLALDSTRVLAIAFGVGAEVPSLRAYIGDPTRDPFILPNGAYFIEAVDQNNFVIVLSNQVITAPPNRVALPASFRQANGVQSVERARALKTLANGLARIELTKLAALQGASGNFAAPLFDPRARVSQTELDRLYAQYGALVAQQPDMLAALASVEPRATAVLPRQVASNGARPASGVFDKIKTQLTGFFGYAGDAGKRAGERIIATSAQLSPDDKQDAFDSIRPGLRGDAKNYAELIEKIKAGALDTQATQIESDLRNAPGYIVAAQQKNQTVGEIVRQEGAELVVKGGELQAQIIKTVLADVFPDISTGFDYADKVKDWVEYVNQVYSDPLGVVGGKLSDAAKEKIKERIKSDLEKCCGQMSDKLREQIADKVSDKTVTAVADALTSGTITPAAKPGTTLIAQATQTLAIVKPIATETVTATTTPTLIPTPTSLSTPTVSPTPTPSATPTLIPSSTPNLSWIDAYLEYVANYWMLNYQVNPIQAAIMVEEMRVCLINAVQNGATQSAAKDQCAYIASNVIRTATPTQTAPPVCAGAPVIASFTANPGTINAGQSSTLSWGLVTNASAVYLENDGVATPGSTQVNPGTTKTYTLRAVGCGGTTTRQVTITVNPAPQPTQPPTAISKKTVGIGYEKYQFSGQNLWADMAIYGGRCRAEVIYAPDGTFKGECSITVDDGVWDRVTTTHKVNGKADQKSGTVNFTEEITENHVPKVAGRQPLSAQTTFTGTGKLTSSTQGSGTASFRFSMTNGKSTSGTASWSLFIR
jgi:hypothetical protein